MLGESSCVSQELKILLSGNKNLLLSWFEEVLLIGLFD